MFVFENECLDDRAFSFRQLIIEMKQTPKSVPSQEPAVRRHQGSRVPPIKAITKTTGLIGLTVHYLLDICVASRRVIVQ